MNRRASFTIKKITGKEIEPSVEGLARLRIDIFSEFPYLYDGSFKYEKNYLKTYVHSADSIAILVLDGDDVVGASTGLPLADETEEFKKPFIARGYDPASIFYCGESILRKKYRGKGVYSIFMKQREDHAKKLDRFDTICFCAVSRADDHPLRPKHYKPLDPVWKKFGYKKHPDLKTDYYWHDLNEEKESAKEMIFWLKGL